MLTTHNDGLSPPIIRALVRLPSTIDCDGLEAND